MRSEALQTRFNSGAMILENNISTYQAFSQYVAKVTVPTVIANNDWRVKILKLPKIEAQL